MEISNPPPLPQLVTLALATTPPDIKSWQPGQILNALVVKVTAQGNMILQIGDTSIQANSAQLNPAPGQMLKLEVVRTEPQTVLKIHNPPAPAQPLAEAQTEALRILLPRQTALPPLLANLVLLANNDSRAQPVLPHNIAVMIRKLINDLPTDKKLANADGLKRALLLSGMFLENKLAGATTTDGGGAIDQDLKANLLRLLSNLQQTSPSTPPRNLPPNLSAQPTGPQSTATNAASSVPAGSSGMTQNPNIHRGVNPGLSPNLNASATPSTAPRTDSNTNTGTNPAGIKYEMAQPAAKLSAPPLMPQTPLQAQEKSAASVSSHQTSSQIIEELTQQVSGAIARLQIHQVSALPTEDNQYPALSFELPLQHENRIDVIQVRIYQDRSSKTAGNPDRWSASLAMELESLGAVYATVTLSQQQVWTTLWAENKATAEIINQHLQELYTGYSRAGLNVGTTHCNHGTPPLSVKNSQKVLVDANV